MARGGISGSAEGVKGQKLTVFYLSITLSLAERVRDLSGPVILMCVVEKVIRLLFQLVTEV